MRALIIAAALAAVAGPALAERPLAPANGKTFTMKRDAEQCEVQPDVSWCGGPTKATPPNMGGMRAYGVMRRAESAARGTFTLKEMPVDLWRSYADEAQAGQAWADDCSGLASTVVDLLARQGWPKGDVYRVLVSTGGKYANHMIGLVRTPTGRLMVVGDTLRNEPYEWEKVSYDIKAVSPVDKGPIWFEY